MLLLSSCYYQHSVVAFTTSSCRSSTAPTWSIPLSSSHHQQQQQQHKLYHRPRLLSQQKLHFLSNPTVPKHSSRVSQQLHAHLPAAAIISSTMTSMHCDSTYVLTAILWLSTFGISLEKRTTIGKALSVCNVCVSVYVRVLCTPSWNDCRD